MKSSTLVSVTIRTRNRVGYLRVAVESVLSQTHQDWELIISDDDSTDETPIYGKHLQHSEPRVTYIRHEPGLGASNNWRFCLANSRGKYFAALDDDNRYLPDFLKRSIAAFECSPDIGFTFSDEWRIDAVGKRDDHATEVDSAHYHRTDLEAGICKNAPLLTVQQTPSINASLFDREVLIQAGGFRELAGDLADFDVFLNLSSQGCKAAYIAERLVEYRQHGDQDGHSYLRSIEKAQSSIAILESVSFSGEAEQARKQKLSQAYTTLSRTLLLNSDVAGARQALEEALRIQPANLRLRGFALALRLPSSVLRYGVKRRYES